MPVFKRAVFMAINPRWCYKIFTGEKTLEIRKTMPTKLNPPFDVYVYCTAPAKRSRVNAAITVSDDELYIYPNKGLRYGSSIGLMCCDEEYSRDNFLNGKCIGKFTVDKITLVDCDSAKILQELSKYDNGDDYILIRSAHNGGGFYRTIAKVDIEAIEAFKRECLHKGRSLFAPIKKINRVLGIDETQISLFEDNDK